MKWGSKKQERMERRVGHSWEQAEQRSLGQRMFGIFKEEQVVSKEK